MSAGVAGRSRLLAVAALSCTIGCVAALHLLRPDLPPLGHRLSEYANGPYGWLMTAAFTTLAVGLLALGAGLRASGGAGRGRWSGRPSAAEVLAYLGGIGALLAGVYRTGGPDHRELIHSAASTSAAVAIVVVALLGSRSRVGAARPTGNADTPGLCLALSAPPLLLVSVVLHGTAWAGLGQRLLWIVLLAWLLRSVAATRPVGPSLAAPVDPSGRSDTGRTAPEQRRSRR